MFQSELHRRDGATARGRSRLAAGGLLISSILAAALGTGCTASSDREAYFKSRSDAVAAAPGSGATRMAVWPSVWLDDSALALRGSGPMSDVTAVPSGVD